MRSLVLRVPGWPGHLPGQHVDVRLTAPDGYQAQRSFSVASAPQDEHVMLTVERLDDGEVSPYLTEVLRPGDRLELRGPLTEWFVWEPSLGGPVFLVAGGSGIVPFMAMARTRAARRSPLPMRLLYSARSEDAIIYRSELDRLAAKGDGFDVVYTLTRTAPEGWPGPRGRVDEQLLAAITWPPEATAQAFVCGPTAFVEAVASGLVAIGYEPPRIKTERFGPSG